ncbi:hypothetical protein AB447_220110 [Bacillus glycinifermentans]|uniref:Uncharacterized protein n=1 Tax=Bacillus glycinifermentans TaxID=1664069 RepID=A0A0T6BNL3_9BACI|nr:hypothetical protein AB447_220110 [Bacillus glycinifermentans]
MKAMKNVCLMAGRLYCVWRLLYVKNDFDRIKELLILTMLRFKTEKYLKNFGRKADKVELFE